MERDNISGLMEVLILVIWPIIRFREKVSIFGPMADIIMENGLMAI